MRRCESRSRRTIQTHEVSLEERIMPESIAGALAGTESLLHQLLDPCVEAGVLSQDEWQQVMEKLHDLMVLIDDRSVGGEDFWTRFRDMFDFAHADPSVVPMSAANLCPEPSALIEAARKAIAAGLGIKAPKNLALVRNASEGNNAVNCGFRNWQASDNVVLWDKNHPTNLDAWKLRRENGRFTVREVSFETDDTDDQI